MNALSRTCWSVLIASVVLIPAGAGAFTISLDRISSTQLSRWCTPELTYYVDDRGVTGISGSTSEQIMVSSFNDWTAVNCTAMNFTKLGNSSSQDILPITYNVNGKNELVWVTGSTECKQWTFGDSALGVTLPMTDMVTGEITEADIAFNNCNYAGKWVAYAEDLSRWDQISFKAVAIHEIGHFFGQHHVLNSSEYSENDPPTMAPYVDFYGRGDDLNTDDKKGPCFLYPADGFYSCSKTTDCPMVITYNSSNEEIYDRENFTGGRMTCSKNYCIGLPGTSPGTVNLGSLCMLAEACKSGGLCMDIGDGKNRCTQTCDLEGFDCPGGYHCATTDGKDVCVIGSVAGSDGTPCNNKADCLSDYCFLAKDGNRTCRTQCRAGTPCADGMVCVFNNGIGGCFPGTVELKPDGQYCTDSDQCESGLCQAAVDGRKCRQVCDAVGQCLTGYHCNLQVGACLLGDEPVVVEPTKTPEGGVCTENADCESGLCYAKTDAETRHCRVSCSLEDWVCPTAGTACLSTGSTETGVCIPTDDKAMTGESCERATDCFASICLGSSGLPLYCTQNCVDSWCPDGFHCADVKTLGMVCLKTVVTDGDNTTDADNGGVSEPVSGCSAVGGGGSASSGIASLVLMLIFATALIIRRRRQVQA